MSQETELLMEIRDLLQVIAEPALAARDASLRQALLAIVGKSRKAAEAIPLMDGSRSQSVIAKSVGMDQSNVSRLVKALSEASLLASSEKQPKLRMKIPNNFFEIKD